MLIREPVPDDAAALGRIHVLAWQEGYRDGLMPDEYPAGLSIDAGPADQQPEVGEVYAHNVDPAFWGRGHGTALLEQGTARLGEAGFSVAVLWVHPGNRRARRFYKRAGWAADETERRAEVLGVAVPELRYRLSRIS